MSPARAIRDRRAEAAADAAAQVALVLTELELARRETAAAWRACAPDQNITIRNVLGEERIGHLHAGDLVCPFCAGYSRGPACQNPACEAGPCQTAESILARRARLAEQWARIETERERSRVHAEYARRWREQQDREVGEAREAGYCIRCFVRSGHRKRIRHRTVDYHEAAA